MHLLLFQTIMFLSSILDPPHSNLNELHHQYTCARARSPRALGTGTRKGGVTHRLLRDRRRARRARRCRRARALADAQREAAADAVAVQEHGLRRSIGRSHPERRGEGNGRVRAHTRASASSPARPFGSLLPPSPPPSPSPSRTPKERNPWVYTPFSSSSTPPSLSPRPPEAVSGAGGRNGRAPHGRPTETPLGRQF